MSQMRPRNVTQGDLAALLRDNGYKACTKAAVSLAERSTDTGVQFTQKAKNIIRGQFKPATRAEKRVNPNKTTVWLDDETRAWLETRAYMEDTSVGELIRRIIGEARTKDTDSSAAPQNDKEKAASDAATSEAAETVPNEERDWEPVPYGHLHDTTKQEGNQA